MNKKLLLTKTEIVLLISWFLVIILYLKGFFELIISLYRVLFPDPFSKITFSYALKEILFSILAAILLIIAKYIKYE